MDAEQVARRGVLSLLGGRVLRFSGASCSPRGFADANRSPCAGLAPEARPSPREGASTRPLPGADVIVRMTTVTSGPWTSAVGKRWIAAGGRCAPLLGGGASE